MPEREQPLRVLHIATSHNDGGIERYSVQIAVGLMAAGVRVWFACLPGAIVERLCKAAQVPTLPLHVRNSGDLNAIWQIAALIKQQSIDIVHVHSRRDYLPALLGVVLARRQARRSATRPRLVLHAHMVRPLGTPIRLSSRVFARAADRVLAVSKAVEDALQAWHHFKPGFVRLLPNGVDVSRFAVPSSPRAAAWRAERRSEWRVPTDALVIAMIGRLDAKGQSRMIAALPRLLPHAGSLYVVLVGSEGKSGTHNALQNLACARDVEQQVRFTGEREDIPQILAASDILVHLPSDESYGLALAEAMASGLPTVASNVGGCREVVQNGETGILVPLGNASVLTTALQSLVWAADAATRRSRLGTAGRERVEKYFSLQQQARQIQEVYQELCPNPSPSADLTSAPLSLF